MNSSSVRNAFALAIVCLLVAPAAAQKKKKSTTKYTRTQNIKIKVKVNRSAKIKPKTKAQIKKEKRPALGADAMISVMGKAQYFAKQQIVDLKALIGETDDDDAEKPKFYFMLAEKYGKLNRYWRIRAIDLDLKIDTSKSSRTKRRLKKKQKGYFRESRKHLLNALKVYKAIYKNPMFKNYKRMDEALFYFAFTLQQAKYLSEARKIFHRLIKDYPNSKYIPNAYLSFADYFFNKNALENAEKFYDKVLHFRKSPVYTYALYKKGWVYLNLDKNQAALEAFYKVADLTKNNKRKRTLNRAAKKDFVRAYAEIGRPRKALQAFRRVDRKYSMKMLEILAGLYLDKGRAHKAIFTFRQLIKIRPKDKQVCEWQYNVVQAMLTVGNNTQKVAAIENLVKLYAAYSRMKVLPKDALAECFENAEGVNNEMAKLWHNEAMKTKNLATLAYVERLYKLYVKSFPKSKELGDMQYWYAELLWQRADGEKNQRRATDMWERAAIAFTAVVKSGRLDKKRMKTSAKAAVLAWKNALAVDPRTKTKSKPDMDKYKKVPKKKDISPRQMKMIAAFDIYINYVTDKKDKELVMMKFLKARIYWRHNHFDRAIPLLEDIVGNHIGHESAGYAVNVLLDTLNRAQKYDKMLYWVDFLLKPKNKEFLKDRAELAESLGILKTQSLRKSAEKKEKGGRYIECGDAYAQIFNRNPKANKAHELLYNAGVCYEKGKSIGAAIKAFSFLQNRFPKTLLAKRAIVKLGYNFGKVAWYEKAAEKYEEYAKRFASQKADKKSGLKSAYDALSTAVFFRKGIGHDKEAVRNTKDFVRSYKRTRKKAAAEAYYSLWAIYDKQPNKEKVAKHFGRYLRLHGANGGVDRRVIAHAKIGMIYWKSSCPRRTIQGACVKITRKRGSLRKRKRKRRRKGLALQTQCGPESKIKLTIMKRDKNLVRSAQRQFKRAIALFAKGKAIKKVGGAGKEKAVRTVLMIKHFAAAKFFMNESNYEKFLSLNFPRGLDFDPKKKKKLKRSQKRFGDWVKKKKNLMGKTAGAYHFVRKIAGGGAHYAIAAAARIGQLSQNFSDVLFTAPIPKDVRKGEYADEKIMAYCDELIKVSNPLEDISVKAYSFCLGVSTKLNWFNAWSRTCEKELGEIRPSQFPSTAELFAVANNNAPITTTELPALELAK